MKLKSNIEKIKKIVQRFEKEALKIPRHKTLENILKENNILYKKDVNTYSLPNRPPDNIKDAVMPVGTYTNFIVPLHKEDQLVSFAIGAHFDKVHNSKGINDNAVAVAVLIQLAINLKDKITNFELVFFDKEESGMHGSTSYAQKSQNIAHVLVLDIIGFGDTPIMCLPHFNPPSLNKIKKVNAYLPSDNLAILAQGVKSTLMVAVPKEDLNEVSPTQTNLIELPTFYSSFHGREFDDIKYINWNTVNKIYNVVEDYIIKGDYNE